MPLEIIHISDTHIGPDHSLDIRGANSWRRACALVEQINILPFKPDLVVHTGDVVNDPDPDAYALAEEVLSGLELPIYYSAGNHDEVPMMRKALTFPEHQSLIAESTDRLCYRITHPSAEEYDLLVIDSRVPSSEGAYGVVPLEQIEALADQISGEKPVAVFSHYPMLETGSKWIDEHLLIANREEVLEMLKDKAGDQLKGIFTGHLHRGMTLFRDGVLNSGVSSPACEFTAWPEGDFCDFISGGPIPFNHVTLTPEAAWVKSYSIPFDESS
tara:strand:+ start:17653 stop:18468 length:816 start_codon:yes stop_codon:yes gene_type:complete